MELNMSSWMNRFNLPTCSLQTMGGWSTKLDLKIRERVLCLRTTSHTTPDQRWNSCLLAPVWWYGVKITSSDSDLVSCLSCPAEETSSGELLTVCLHVVFIYLFVKDSAVSDGKFKCTAKKLIWWRLVWIFQVLGIHGWSHPSLCRIAVISPCVQTL